MFGLFTKRTKGKSSVVRFVDSFTRRMFSGGFWDAEQLDPSFSRHFAPADAGAADSHASPSSRKTIRQRVRFEFANNAYFQGIVRTHVNNVIGTGPRLQIQHIAAGISETASNEIERVFATWCRASGFIERLRLAFQAWLVDGEAFIVFTTDKRHRHPISLTWKVIECDQCMAPPEKAIGDPNHVDGIDIDEADRPIRYWFLKQHPGAAFGKDTYKFEPVPAEMVIHLFRKDRPGQHRGVSRCAAMLMPAAALRQYIMASIKAAHRHASVTGVISTNSPQVSAAECAPFDPVYLDDDTFMTLPAGWEMHALKAEQPTSTFKEVKKEFVSEMGRPFGMPNNKASADSSGYNYASGRLDHQDYGLEVRVDRDMIECIAMGPTLREFAREAVLAGGDMLSAEAREVLNVWLNEPEGFPPSKFGWDMPEHADPLKEAQAADMRLRNRTSTLADEYGRRNQDWLTQLEQISREQAKMAELGLTMEQAAPSPPQDPNANDGTNTDSTPQGQSDAVPA